MISGRIVFIVLMLAVVSTVFWEFVDLATPPSHRQPAPNSFSGRVNGHRALFEVLETLGHPVERATDFFARGDNPPDPQATRVLIIEPDLFLMDRENANIDAAVAWVNAGGHLVIVARELDLLESIRRRTGPEPNERAREYEQTERILGEKGLVKALGIEELRVRSERGAQSEPAWHERDVVRLHRLAFERPEANHTLAAQGTLEGVLAEVETVRLPEQQPRGFAGRDVGRAQGSIEATHEDGHRFPIALDFAVGEGRVLVCSEPALFTNLGLITADNAVVAYRLAAGDGRRALFYDEYFHGAMPIGRPLALFGIFPYGLIALSLILATAITAWCAGIRFGPPLADPPPSRRSILEYVDAMARLFHRSGQHRFVLHACLEGVLEDVRAEVFLPHGTPPGRVLHALERRDPARARRLDTAINEAKEWLQGDARLPRRRLAELQGNLEACRIPKAPSPRLPMASVRYTAAR